jgi:hypothetical protein
MGGMRNVIGLLTIGVLIAACGPTQHSKNLTGDKLYEAAGQNILVIDSRNQSIERRLPLGAPSIDWKHLYSMVGDSIVDTDPVTGNTQNSIRVGADYQLPPATHTGLPGGLSPHGAWLVLQTGDASSTHMAIVDTRAFKVTDRLDLAGRFVFDAISDDGQRLYLIQYLNGKEYYVRLFDVPTNSLDANIVVDKSDGNQAMAGLRLSGIATPDGASLFSMYVRADQSPFIHALSLSGPFAFCIDLPGAGYATGQASSMQWALAMNQLGTRVYAINGASGTVAEVDSSSMQVLRTAQIKADPSGAIGAGAAALSPDGKMLVTASNAGIVWVDTSNLQVRMEALAEWHVWSLGLTPDGQTLFAVSDAGQVAEVSMSSGAVLARFDPGAGKPLALMRVAAS